jgi:hypothetical protein
MLREESVRAWCGSRGEFLHAQEIDALAIPVVRAETKMLKIFDRRSILLPVEISA